MEIVACCIFVLFSKNAEMLLPGNILPRKSFFFPNLSPQGRPVYCEALSTPTEFYVFPLESETDAFPQSGCVARIAWK